MRQDPGICWTFSPYTVDPNGPLEYLTMYEEIKYTRCYSRQHTEQIHSQAESRIFTSKLKVKTAG